MKKTLFLNLLIIFTLGFVSCVNQVEKNPHDRAINQKVEKILSHMSLQEKVGQMTQITLSVLTKGPDAFTTTWPAELDSNKVKVAFEKYKIGSVLNTDGNNEAHTTTWWNKNISFLQKQAIEKTGIPVLYGIDAIHGTTYTAGATLFPQQIGQGATFNPSLVKKLNEICAYETRASGIPWNFSPVLDMGRDPRDPRMWETYGEDVYENSVMATAAVIGLQGKNSNAIDKYHVAACMKHFIAYNSNSGKDRNPLTMSARDLFERDVPDFQAAVDAGDKSVMISSGILNGIPVHSSKAVLTDLLRNEMGFQGLIVTDWADIENLHNRDKVAITQKEAVRMAIDAGIDMSMVPYNYKFCDYLIQLVKEGKISESRIDASVRRILKLKFELGLFESPVTYAKDYPAFGSKSFEAEALKTARESITLLKNQNNILPLKKNAKVLVCGPNANSMRTLNGGWSYSWQGEKADQFASNYNTILEAIRTKIGKKNIKYVPGVTYKMDGKYYEENKPDIATAVKAAKSVDYVVLCLGENSYTEKPGDLVDLYLSDNQTQLALALAKTHKPVILVLNEGRPRLISKFEPKMKAVIQTYLPGNFGGDALADILFGDVNPSGKLPYTYPKYPNSLNTYDFKPSEKQSKQTNGYNYAGTIQEQYSFGTGLSYTTFNYDHFKINKDTINPNEKTKVSIEVTNTGKREGKEVVMLYSSDEYASITPDNKRLRRFLKIDLKPGESKTVSFEIDAKDLSFINRNNQRVAEAGDFVLSINKFHSKIYLTGDVAFGKPSKVRM